MPAAFTDKMRLSLAAGFNVTSILYLYGDCKWILSFQGDKNLMKEGGFFLKKGPVIIFWVLFLNRAMKPIFKSCISKQLWPIEGVAVYPPYQASWKSPSLWRTSFIIHDVSRRALFMKLFSPPAFLSSSTVTSNPFLQCGQRVMSLPVSLSMSSRTLSFPFSGAFIFRSRRFRIREIDICFFLLDKNPK